MSGIREAAKRGAQIVCLEELFRSQYFCREENHDRFDLAEPIPGPSTEALGKLAARTERRDRRFALRAPRRRPLSQHRRGPRRRRLAAGHLPQDAHSRRSALLRKILFHARRSRLPQFRHALRPHRRAGLLGPVVSRRRAPRQPARREYSCSIPRPSAGIPPRKREFGAAQLDAWRTIQRSHAIANGIFVAAVNRVGFEGPPESGIEFWGSSFVADPFGQVLAEASTDKEETLIVECDLRRMEEVRRNWPFLRDRRTDAYGPSRAMARLTPARAKFLARPHKLGYRMPAEWEPHEATWLAWPHERTDWPGKFAPIPWVYADIVRHLARVERVRILVGRPRREEQAPGASSKKPARISAPSISSRVPTNRGWTRDFGPIFVKKRKPDAAAIALTNWRFNAWAKYDDWKNDNAATSRLIPKLKLPVWEPQYQRPPRGARRRQHRRQRPRHPAHHRRMPAQPSAGPQSGPRPAQISKPFSATISAPPTSSGSATASPATTRTATWTTSRASSIPTTVVTVVEADRADANYEPLQENLARLRKMKDQDGQPLRVETLPMPAAGLLRRPAPARELRQFLHRQRPRARPHLQRPERPRRAQHAGRAVPRPRSRRHRLPRPGPRPRHAPLHDPAAARVETLQQLPLANRTVSRIFV